MLHVCCITLRHACKERFEIYLRPRDHSPHFVDTETLRPCICYSALHSLSSQSILFLPKVLDLQTTRNTYLFTDSLFGANSLGGFHQSDTVAACSALYLAKPCAAKMRSNCHSTRSPNHQRLIYKIGRSSTAKKLLASFHTHKFVASACVASAYVACAFRHSTRLGELLLGQYDVLFQMLQSLTLANISIIEFFSTEKIYHASLLGYHRYKNVRVTGVPYNCVLLPQVWRPEAHVKADEELVAQPQALRTLAWQRYRHQRTTES
jgi:hypothetical protein